MIRTTEELLEAIREKLGDDTSDEALTLLEDATDTIADLADKIGEDWKAKYEENDAMWRQRYRDRFNGKTDEDEDTVVVDEDEDGTIKALKYDKLFKEE